LYQVHLATNETRNHKFLGAICVNYIFRYESKYHIILTMIATIYVERMQCENLTIFNVFHVLKK
jgi:hypothetical protein